METCLILANESGIPDALFPSTPCSDDGLLLPRLVMYLVFRTAYKQYHSASFVFVFLLFSSSPQSILVQLLFEILYLGHHFPFIMSFLSISSLLYAALLIFLLDSSAVLGSTPGTLRFYDDWNCEDPSTLNPIVSLSLSTCLQTTNGYGVIVGAAPPCPSGTATLIFYQDPICGTQVDIGTTIFANNCYMLAEGIGIFDAKSLMFACAPAANDPQPSSFSTVIVSGVPVATSAAGGGSATSTGSASAITTSVTSPATTETPNSNPTGSGSNSSGSTTNTSSASSGLSTSDVVAIVVGVGVGVLTIAVTIAIWLFPDFRDKLRSWLCCGASGQSEPGAWGQNHHQTHPGMPQVHQRQPYLNAPPQYHGYGGQAPYNPVRWN